MIGLGVGDILWAFVNPLYPFMDILDGLMFIVDVKTDHKLPLFAQDGSSCFL